MLGKNQWSVLAATATLVLLVLRLCWSAVNKLLIRNTRATAERELESASLPSSVSQGYEYEVFLSFRGTDTRAGFTDFLYRSLVDAGVCVFRDNEGLPVGEEIGPELLHAIRQSKICIPVFSEGYASSKWCLREIAEVAKCRKKRGQLVLPVFYNVEPSDVRHQRGSFKSPFQDHEKDFRPEVVSEWREALQEVGALKGWSLKHTATGHGHAVKIIVTKVLSELKKAYLVVTDCLVGVEKHVDHVMRLVQPETNDVKIIWIHGMGGIGKTTLAKVVYNQLSDQFKCHCFLADIRQTSLQHKGIESLQNRLISEVTKYKCLDIGTVDDGIITIRERVSSMKVLLLLDDVDEKAQLDALAGNHGWFGPGSRIIITTRKRDIASALQVDSAYELQELDGDQSLKLFSKHAFRREHPPVDRAMLSRDITFTTGGLPLALEVIGCFLCNKPQKLWESTLERLKKIPDKQVQRKLEISYEALNREQKQIFLDIACLFLGMDKRIVFHLWEDCELYPEIAMEELLLMSLVKIGNDNVIRMHDQLRDLGREIVRSEDSDIGKRSRLWIHGEALTVLRRKAGTERVEALCLEFKSLSKGHHGFSSEDFSKLQNLKFLQLDYGDLSGDFENLIPELRWLHWHGSPKNFEPTNFQATNIVILDLSWSKITKDWKGWRQMKMEKLKVLNLTGCVGLVRTPDFSGYGMLERLVLERCKNLIQIDSSIGRLTNLAFLNLRFCSKLRQLPQELGSLEALSELLIDGTSVQEIPVSQGYTMKLETLSATHFYSVTQISSSIAHFQSLLDLALDGAEIIELPESIGALMKLQRLSLRYCGSLERLPQSIGQLKSLLELDVSRTRITELPGSIANLKYLKVLNADYSCIRRLPDVIGMLEKLEELHASSCTNLEGDIPSGIGRLSCLRTLTLDCTDIRSLPESLYQLPNLQKLDLFGCTELQSLPELPCRLLSLRITCLYIEMIPGLSRLIKLKELCLAECYKLDRIPDDITKLMELESLSLIGLNIRCLPAEVGAIPRLEVLNIQDCKELRYIEKIPPSLVKLSIRGCELVEVLPNMLNMNNMSELVLSPSYELFNELDDNKGFCFKSPNSLQQASLKYLDISCLMSDTGSKLKETWPLGCTKLVKIQGLGQLGLLKFMDLSCCTIVERLPNLSKLGLLKGLYLKNCEKLQVLDGLEDLKSLKRLDISGCKPIDQLPDISSLMDLTELRMQKCEKLKEIEGLGELRSLEFLDMSGCWNVERLPDLSGLRKLRELRMKDCQKLNEIRGLDRLDCLEFLEISGCKLIRCLPNISRLKNLQELRALECRSLGHIPGLRKLRNPKILDVSGSQLLQDLPDLPNLMK